MESDGFKRILSRFYLFSPVGVLVSGSDSVPKIVCHTYLTLSDIGGHQGGVQCERFDKALFVVLKTLALVFFCMGGVLRVFPFLSEWGSPKPIHLKPGHLKMAFSSARCCLDGAFFV